MWVVGAGFVGVEFNKIQSVSNSNAVEKCGKVMRPSGHEPHWDHCGLYLRKQSSLKLNPPDRK